MENYKSSWKSSRESEWSQLSKAAENIPDMIINELICKKIYSKMAVNNGKIEVPLEKDMEFQSRLLQ